MEIRADSGRVYADAVARGFSNYRANMYRRRQKELNKKNQKYKQEREKQWGRKPRAKGPFRGELQLGGAVGDW